jgi:large subunit ribosomal protein L13e
MLQAAGIPRKLAPTVGIAVDPRRQNLSEESLKPNVARLQEYKKRLILFPRRSGKTKTGDAAPADVKKAKAGEGITRKVWDALAIENVVEFPEVKISEVDATENAYIKLRMARADARYVGVREKRAKAKAEEAANAKK